METLIRMAHTTGLDAQTAGQKGSLDKPTLDDLLSDWRAKSQKAEHQLLAELRAQIGLLLDRELEAAITDTRRAVRRRLTDELNQAVRRLRQAASAEEVTHWLLDASSPFCERAAMLGVHGGFLQGLSLRGVEAEPCRQLFEALDLPLEEAAALLHSVQQKEPVVAIASPAEVSPHLMDIFHHGDGDRVLLFPVVVHGETAAILYAAGSDSPDAPALELLTEVAATKTETLVSAPLPPVAPAPAALVQIQSAPQPPPREVQPPEWGTLGKEEQELHVLARRFARVHVAEIRLYQAARVENGRSAERLYAELKKEIDHARETFRQKFMLASSTMVDYFHLELVRSLAHDNVALLGRDYPGALS